MDTNAMALYGLIFDIDGVIADTEPLNAKVTIKVFADMFGLENVQPGDFRAGIGRGAEKFVQAAADVHGLELTEDQINAAAALREQYLIQAMRDEPLPAFAGVLELIQSGLQDQSCRLAIATSASEDLSRTMLESVKVPYQKMVYMHGGKVKKKKPDPEIFLLAARGMGIEPSRCVVFEDAPSGVQAAKAAGAKCIAITNTTTADKLSEADMICSSLEQVDLKVLRNLIDGSK